MVVLYNEVVLLKYDLIPSYTSGYKYNCNSFSNSILNISGATNQEDYVDMKGIDPGKNSRIDIKYFR